MSDHFVMRGTLKGHSGWITSIATTAENPDMLLSGSRDKKVIVWSLTRDEESYGYARRALTGHSHFVYVTKRLLDGSICASAWLTRFVSRCCAVLGLAGCNL